MRDRGVGVGEAGQDVLALQLGVVVEELVRRFTLREEVQHGLDGDPQPPAEQLRKLSERFYRPESELIRDAIREYLDRHG